MLNQFVLFGLFLSLIGCSNGRNSSFWITTDLLQEVVIKDEKFAGRSAVVKSFNLTTDLAKGAASTLFRVNIVLDINGTNVPFSYIAKTSLNTPMPINITNTDGIFPKENEVLGTLIPEFEKLYRDVGVEISFGPRCYKIVTAPEYFALIMEDLKPERYMSSTELDMRHVWLTIKKFAEFHAASVVYHKKVRLQHIRSCKSNWIFSEWCIQVYV